MSRRSLVGLGALAAIALTAAVALPARAIGELRTLITADHQTSAMVSLDAPLTEDGTPLAYFDFQVVLCQPTWFGIDEGQGPDAGEFFGGQGTNRWLIKGISLSEPSNYTDQGQTPPVSQTWLDGSVQVDTDLPMWRGYRMFSSKSGQLLVDRVTAGCQPMPLRLAKLLNS